MRLLLILLALTCAGCAETRLYEHGQLVAVIQGDATNVTLKTADGFTFHADTLNHSTATIAWGTAATQVVGAAAAGAVSAATILK